MEFFYSTSCTCCYCKLFIYVKVKSNHSFKSAGELNHYRRIRLLEEDSLVQRVVYPEVPPKVEYRLTTHGEKLLEVFDVMEKWGLEYAKAMGGQIEE